MQKPVPECCAEKSDDFTHEQLKEMALSLRREMLPEEWGVIPQRLEQFGYACTCSNMTLGPQRLSFQLAIEVSPVVRDRSSAQQATEALDAALRDYDYAVLEYGVQYDVYNSQLGRMDYRYADYDRVQRKFRSIRVTLGLGSCAGADMRLPAAAGAG